MQRIGLVAGASVILAGGAYLTANEVQGTHMPSVIYWFIIVSALAVLSLAVPTWAFVHVGLPAFRFLRAHDFWVRKDTPNPNQWLLDIAREDAENPDHQLLIMRQTITDMDLRAELERPWIELGFTLYNAGVHTVTVGPATGHVRFEALELKEPVESQAPSSKLRGHAHEYKIKQYLSPDQAKSIYDEIAKTHRVRTLDCTGVKLEVRADADDAQPVRMSLGSSEFRRKD